MTDNLTSDPAAYLRELQRIEREQELAKLRTLSLEFAGVLEFFPKLREELEAFHHADGIAFDGLTDRLRPALKTAANRQFEIEHLSIDLRNAPEMQTFLQHVKKTISLQSVKRLDVQFHGVCQDIHQRHQKEKSDKERRAKEEMEHQARKKADKERQAKEEMERQAKEKADKERRVREETEHQAKEKAEAELWAREEADLQFEIEQLPTDLHNAPEMQAFLQQVKKINSLQAVSRLKTQFQGVCQDISQRLEKEKREADRRVWEETKRQAREKAEAERQAKEEAERQTKEEYECLLKNRINQCNKKLFIFTVSFITVLFAFFVFFEDEPKGQITTFIHIFIGMFWGYSILKKDIGSIMAGGSVSFFSMLIVTSLSVFLLGSKVGALWEFPWKPQHVVL